MLAVGGDDSILRVYFVNKETFAEVKLKQEITNHVDRIVGLDFNYNSSLLISCGVDKACYIYNMTQKGQKMHKITFTDQLIAG
jgi:WD40 repeat protein